MRWTPRGAHLLLQIRTRVLNNTLTNDYRRWYPNFTHTTDHQTLAAWLPRFFPLSLSAWCGSHVSSGSAGAALTQP
jgi:hypothetical protein